MRFYTRAHSKKRNYTTIVNPEEYTSPIVSVHQSHENMLEVYMFKLQI